MVKLFGGLVDSNERELKRLRPLVSAINSLEPDFEGLSDTELRGKTDQFKARYRDGEKLDDLLPETFAVVRESSKRTLGLRHFDVQLMGGIVLHQGKIAEMKTGEGKTLVATLPLYLNSLTGEGCHLITVNDYLSKRDPHWMGPIYGALGVSVASIQHEASCTYDPTYESEDDRWSSMRPVSRPVAYQADITYGTNNEFGFDYLRDNMVNDLSLCVQRPVNYAIVDEVDNILIDEARTPLIISGQAEEAAQMYHAFARLVPRLKREEDYEIDPKDRSVKLTDTGVDKVEGMLKKEGLLKSPDLYDLSNYGLMPYLDSALKSHIIFRRDKDYVVKDGQVVIVDEFTGRLMFGRRYSEGLHQAIEAKEGVRIKPESITMASITFQNYFRLYRKLAGMTGTAVTEAEEFHKIYRLDVVVIPTHEPMVRTDHTDLVYRAGEIKFRAVADEIERLHKEQCPVLVGTTSIEKSEELSEMLVRRGVPHEVLNAKNHEKEAYIIAQAGKPGAVTVATNMAGRGVDIILGGNPEGRSEEEWRADHDKVVGRGGLHIIGTERHEARRIDNQLRGRAGRQGDPGSSRFYVSLEDEVVHRFGGDRVQGLMKWAGIGDEDIPIENRMVSRAIAESQKRVEGYHFEIRKHLVEYDDVINKHREEVYRERWRILSGEGDLKDRIQAIIGDELHGLVAVHGDGDQLDVEGLLQDVGRMLPPSPDISIRALDGKGPEEIESTLVDYADSLYQKREEEKSPEIMRALERWVMLRSLDRLWIDHLTIMERTRQGIGLQSVGQRDPLVVYKKEAYSLFESFKANLQYDVAHLFFHVDVTKREARPKTPVSGAQSVPVDKKIGRNDPCPCGSGKKYKKCCGKDL